VRFQATHKLVTYLLVLASVAALASTDSLPALAALAFLVAWALSWPVDPGGRAAALLDRAAIPLRVAVVGGVCVAGVGVWRQLPDPDLGPVLELLLALLAYKLFHRRSNRDYLHIYVLSFLLVLAASALAGTFLFAAAFAAYVVLATWTLILFHLRREMEENYLVKHSAQAPSQKVGVARILNSRRVVGRSFFAATGLCALGVFAGAVATFAIVPRVGAGLVLGAGRATANVVGFSDDVSLGHYGVLSSENRTVALRAVVPRIAEAGARAGEAARDREIEQLYWRGTVYDRYADGHWTRSREPALRTVLQEHAGRVLVREPAFESAGAAHPREGAGFPRTDRQEIDVVGVPVPVVFALDHPVSLELPGGGEGGGGVRLLPRWSGEVAMRASPFGLAPPPPGGEAADPPGGAAGLGHLGTHYVAYSRDSHGHGTAHRPVEELPADVRAAYLELPPSLSPRVAELARRLSAGQPSAAARAAAIADWLRSTHAYTLRLPAHPAGVDPVEDFLFEHQAGHCEYFASAMVILLRASGIPARYVNGYLGGEWNGIGSYIAVRDNRAHSWAEAYMGADGWVRVDATPAAFGAERAGRLRQLFESVDFYWTRWVVGYDLHHQVDLVRRLGRGLGIGGSGGEPRGAPAERFPSWLLVVAAVAVLAMAASRRWPGLGTRAAPGRGRVAPAEAPVQRLYRRALARLERAGLPRERTETPREYAARVARARAGGSEVLDELTELYTAARFGGRAVDVDTLRAMAARVPEIGRPPS
jgi:hypothetical protein